MGQEERSALSLGESVPQAGWKNTAWSAAALGCALLSAGFLIDLGFTLASAEFVGSIRTFGSVWLFGFSALLATAQTTWGSPLVRRVLPERPPATRPPTQDAD